MSSASPAAREPERHGPRRQPRRVTTPPDPDTLPRPWVEAYPPGVPPTYDRPRVALPRLLDDAVRDFPDRDAMIWPGGALDHAALADRAGRLATGLQAVGLGPGDRVALVLPNLPAAPIALFAVWRLGATVVALDPDQPDDELHRRLADTRAAALVCEATFLPRLQGIRGALPALHHVVVTDPEEWRGRLGRLRARLRRRRPTPTDASWLSRLLDEHAPHPGGAATGDAPALVTYTSGTTGPARPVVLTHDNLVAAAFQARLWIPDVQAGRERVLVASPVASLTACVTGLLSTVLSAGTVVLGPADDGTAVARAVDRWEPTLLVARPPLFDALLDAADGADLTSLRACLSMGGPLPGETMSRFAAATGGARLREAYGLTEASGLVLANPVYGRARPGTAGLPVTDTLACVVDPEDLSRPCSAGEPGLLLVRGPQVMAGYLDDPDATAARLRDGWLLTGDRATMDPDGCVTILGRVDDATGEPERPR